MLKNKRRSKVPFILAGAIIVSAGILIFLQYKDIVNFRKKQPKEEYFPEGSLTPNPTDKFNPEGVKELALAYEIPNIPYIAGIPQAAYQSTYDGIGARISDGFYIYIGTFEQGKMMDTVMENVPTLIADGYNRNGSHAESKKNNSGYIGSDAATYEFTQIYADYNGELKEYYTAIYGIFLTDETYLCISASTTGASDDAKDMCITWIDSIAAGLNYDDSFSQRTGSTTDDNPQTDENMNNSADLIIGDLQITDKRDDEPADNETGNDYDYEKESYTEDGESIPYQSGSSGPTTIPGQSSSSSGREEGISQTSQGENTSYSQQNPTQTSQGETTSGSSQGEYQHEEGSHSSETSSGEESTSQTAPVEIPKPTYDGFADTISMDMFCPVADCPMTIQVAPANRVDEAVCTITAPNGTVYTGWSVSTTAQEGNYRITTTHQRLTGQVAATCSLGY